MRTVARKKRDLISSVSKPQLWREGLMLQRNCFLDWADKKSDGQKIRMSYRKKSSIWLETAWLLHLSCAIQVPLTLISVKRWSTRTGEKTSKLEIFLWVQLSRLNNCLPVMYKSLSGRLNNCPQINFLFKMVYWLLKPHAGHSVSILSFKLSTGSKSDMKDLPLKCSIWTMDHKLL